MTIDEQIAYLTKGCVDVVRPGELRGKLERAGEDRQEADGQGGLRSDRAGSAPGPHRPDPQDEALSGSRPHRRLRGRLVHGADRRSDRPLENAPAADDGGDCGERGDLQDADFQDSRPAEDGDALQQRMARAAGQRRLDQAGGEVQRRADAGAARVQAALRSGKADRDSRVPLSAGAGLRLGGAERRRGARRDRSAVQPQRRPRPDAGLRSRAADRDDDAAARGARRRREDVEEPWQLRRRHGERRPRCSAS